VVGRVKYIQLQKKLLIMDIKTKRARIKTQMKRLFLANLLFSSVSLYSVLLRARLFTSKNSANPRLIKPLLGLIFLNLFEFIYTTISYFSQTTKSEFENRLKQ